MTSAAVGLGSNLGDRAANLREAIEALDWGDARVVARSSVYETEPVGGPAGSPRYLNQVALIETTLDARDLWERCSGVEAALGRSREREERWGPRTIDVDLLLFGEQMIDEPDLVVPHPHLHERAFVLIPLLEVAPDAVVPGRGRASDLAQAVDARGVRRL